MPDINDIAPESVLAFWREAGRERWYKRDAAFDVDVRTRFLDLWRAASSGALASWETGDDEALALVIVLDQFPRNMFRDDALTFSSDAQAREVARRAIAHGADQRVDPTLREFFYLPFMHSEHLPDQLHCVALFRSIEGSENLDYAEEHADIIRRFGRFPYRNRVLGRETTAEEQAFLDAGGFSG